MRGGEIIVWSDRLRVPAHSLFITDAARRESAKDCLLWQSITSFDEGPYKIAALPRPQVLPLLDAFGLIGQVGILYRVPKPRE